MTWPTMLHEVPPPGADGRRPWVGRSWWRRAGRVLRGVGAWLTRPARLLPGLGAVGCAVAGSWLLWGLGVALLVAVPFLLLLDARTPRG